MKTDLKIINLAGDELNLYLSDLANLRIKLFREFPYLYEGDLQYEMKYLKTYTNSPNSRVMLVMDGGKVIGITTSIPLKDEEPDIQQPFIENGFKIDEYYYLGESLLLPEYRGQGVYRKFFEFRELAAKEQGYKKTLFISVVRPDNHLLRPSNYQKLDTIWQHFGYHCIPDMFIYYPWKDVDQDAPTKKPLSIWVKEL